MRNLAVPISAGILGLLFVMATAPAVANNWAVDHANSRLGFEATQGNAPFSGQFQNFTADIIFDPKDLPNARIDVVIDMTSATTGAADKDAALPGTDWFNTAQHPQATFKSAIIRATGDTTYEADGILTMRDKSTPLTLPFTLNIDGDHAQAEGRVTIDRLDFGIGASQPETTASHAVDIIIDIKATR